MSRASAPDVFATRLAWILVLLATGAGCNRPVSQRDKQPPPGPPTNPVVIRQPAKLLSIEANRMGPDAQDLRVPCATCHYLRDPEGHDLPDSPDLTLFHLELQFDHGGDSIRCSSCHVPGRSDQLHLANGETVPMTEVMTVCGQCHGSQLRDYQHGAHGGMTGYWDLSRGGRTRNNCVDCHDPHTPAFVGGQPVLPPRDRFLEGPR